MPILILIWSSYMGAFFDARISFSVLFNWYDYDKVIFFYIFPKLFLFYLNEIQIQLLYNAVKNFNCNRAWERYVSIELSLGLKFILIFLLG